MVDAASDDTVAPSAIGEPVTVGIVAVDLGGNMSEAVLVDIVDPGVSSCAAVSASPTYLALMAGLAVVLGRRSRIL